MKKYLSMILVGMLLVGGLSFVQAAQTSTSVTTKTLHFSQLAVVDDGITASLSLAGANTVLLQPGEPVLPAQQETFVFPFGTYINDVSCVISDIHTSKIDSDIQQTPTPVLAGISTVYTDIQTGVVGAEYQTYPGAWFDYDVSCGISGTEQSIIVTVNIYPVQYTPNEHNVYWADTIDISIRADEPTSQPLADVEYLLVVIGPNEFSSQLAPLITHKTNSGVSSIFVSLNDIYSGTYFPVQGRDAQEQIKYFIKDAIETWGTSYVLLVGGDYEVPVRITHVRAATSDSELFPSDLYYADIYNETSQFCSWDSNANDVFGEYDWGTSHLTDEVDLLPDVYLGRLACISGTEVTTVVNKIITYETSLAYTAEWFTNLIACGGDSFPGDDNGIAEGEYVNDAVISIMSGFIPTRLWASNGGLSGIPSGTTKISNAINAGAGFVDFSGHGNPSVWATHPYEDDSKWLPTTAGGYWNSPHVSGLANGDMLPIVVTGACSVSKYTDRPDCFTWSFISNPDGGGIGSFGATGLGWAYVGEWVTEGLIEGMSTKTFTAYADGATTLGEMWGKALTDYLFPNMEGADYKTMEEWQLFGDPSLAIGAQSAAPAKPAAPTGETSGKINVEYTYTTSTTDPDNDKLYYLFDWGDGEYSGWLGPFSSGATVEGKHTWTERGTYEIRVKAKDDHGVQSEWSDPLTGSMPIDVPINHPLLQFLERFPFLFMLFEKILEYVK
jgi:hypothetical protein